MSGRLRRVAALLTAALAVAAGLTACAETQPVVTILGSWVGAEETAFRQVLDAAGIPYRYEGSRAPGALLQAKLQKHAPPDIVLLPTIGDLADHIRNGRVRALDTLPGDPLRSLADDFGEPWLQGISTASGQHYYWVPIKADLKSIIWYDPTRPPLPGRPDTWTWPRLRGLKWCIGVGDTPNSGWPASDWVEDILLHQAGDGTYRSFVAGQPPGDTTGTLPWTSAAVRQAWQTWGDVLSRTPGGGGAALLTDSADAALGMYGKAAPCQLEHQASFGLRPPAAVPDAPRDFAPFPSLTETGRAWEVSTDVASLFTTSPAAARMMAYLASPRAQAIWPANAAHPAFSVDRQVPATVYGSGPRARIAAVLRGRDTLCLDAGDMMPPAMRDAFYRGLLEYMSAVADRRDVEGQLTRILKGLDRLRQQLDVPLSGGQDWNLPACGHNP
jgi:alpha-glucoside transport system substrate-binding protein